jgi:5-methylcytosine-specific restriction endonuclease McrA
MMFKTCPACGETLPATTEFFYGDKGRHDGLASSCKVCRRAYDAAYRAAHRAAYCEQQRAYSVAYRATHREEIAARRAAHRDEQRTYGANSRARAAGAPGVLTGDDLQAQYDRQKGCCHWCGRQVGADWQPDHVLPFALDGSNYPDNIVIACPHCNLKKAAKHPAEFAGVLC